jgi:hypothetical protein
MTTSWKAFCILTLIAASSFGQRVFASPSSTFAEGNVLYRMKYTTSLVFSAKVSESQYLLYATKHNSFVIGNMAYIRDRENQNAYGSPLRMDGDVKISRVQKRADGSAEVTYTADSEVVIDHAGLKHYTLYLPTDYEAASQLETFEFGKCSIYKSAGSIPMFDMLPTYWTPMINSRCAIAYSKVIASLTPVELKNTYPDYPRLVKNGEVTISIFIGKMAVNDSNSPLGNSFTGSTASEFEYQHIQRGLLNMGMRRVDRVMNQRNQTNFRETYRLEAARAQIRVNLIYGDSVFQGPSMNEYSALFVKAAQEDSVVLYGGHSGFLIDASGLSFYSDMQLKLDPNRYQIFSMNGCQTNYYLMPLFQKKSSKNLDIFLNALETYPNVEGSVAPVRAIVKWAQNNRWTTYRDLVQQMDAKDAMLGVAGEQDNPTSPY